MATIKEIKDILGSVTSLQDPILEDLSKDHRAGVQSLLKSKRKQIEKAKQLLVAHQELLHYEDTLKAQGYQLIAGIDEVGRGPLAGPVVAAAVILPDDTEDLIGVTDSKQLTHNQRETYAEKIKEIALDYAVSEASVEEIDQLNILQSAKLAMKRAVKQLQRTPDYLLIDAERLTVSIPQQSIVKGDARSLSIACASILAKVHRDHYMLQLHEEYPEYAFNRHKGYGTKEHLEALNLLGKTEHHRESFQPIAKITKIYSQKSR